MTDGLSDRMVDFVANNVHEATEVENREAGIRPTGQQIFDSLSKEKQDEMLGPAAADLVRNGEATLADFVQHDGNFITQKPVEGIKAWREEDHPRGRPGNRGQFRDKPKKPFRPTTLKGAPADSPFQAWLDESEMPGPGGEVELAFGWKIVQTSGRTIRWYSQGVGYDRISRGLFLHEVGHIFDKAILNKEDRAAFRKIFGLEKAGWWDGPTPPGEWFAMAYSFAALGQKRANRQWFGYDYNPTKDQQAKVRNLILRAARRKSQ